MTRIDWKFWLTFHTSKDDLNFSKKFPFSSNELFLPRNYQWGKLKTHSSQIWAKPSIRNKFYTKALNSEFSGTWNALYFFIKDQINALELKKDDENWNLEKIGPCFNKNCFHQTIREKIFGIKKRNLAKLDYLKNFDIYFCILYHCHC